MVDKAPTEIVVMPVDQLERVVSRVVRAELHKEAAPLLVDRQTLARQLGCSAAHIDNLRKQGLPVVRVGNVRAVRFEPGAVLEWLRQNSPQDETEEE